jgi:hypothetical protein
MFVGKSSNIKQIVIINDDSNIISKWQESLIDKGRVFSYNLNMFILRKNDDSNLMFVGKSSGLYYKHIMIVNDDFSVLNKWQVSLIDKARVIIYDNNMFIIQATGAYPRGEQLHSGRLLIY